MNWTLKRNALWGQRKGPVITVVLDGVAWGPKDEGDAVHLARKPVLSRLWSHFPTTTLKAHGTAVGLPSDKDMGNSEVGHNALGAGRVFDQGAKLVDQAIESGALFQGEAWRRVVKQAGESGKSLHFIGLLSDGNVHSHINHLLAMIERCHRDGLKTVRIHVLLDGRDVRADSALSYIETLESLLSHINRNPERDYRIASGGGRMWITMDRYNADWSMVERGWKTHVLGEARQFANATQAIETLRSEAKEINDQYLPAFVIAHGGKSIGPIIDGDAVVFFNFRGDRAIEISRAFEEPNLSQFDRVRHPRVVYAGMMQYDGDTQTPKLFLVSPPTIDCTMGEFLARNGIKQFACSETQKYGHVTYFWNGNRTGMFDSSFETYREVPSDNVPFHERPWMKAAEITDETITALRTGMYPFLRINYPNGDMVGHTGNLDAAILAIESVDYCLGRLLKVVDDVGGIAIVTADHGNSDEMIEHDEKTGAIVRDARGNTRMKTSHTLNPVPLTIVDTQQNCAYRLDDTLRVRGLSNVAATAFYLLGYEAPASFDPPLICAT